MEYFNATDNILVPDRLTKLSLLFVQLKRDMYSTSKFSHLCFAQSLTESYYMQVFIYISELAV